MMRAFEVQPIRERGDRDMIASVCLAAPFPAGTKHTVWFTLSCLPGLIQMFARLCHPHPTAYRGKSYTLDNTQL